MPEIKKLIVDPELDVNFTGDVANLSYATKLAEVQTAGISAAEFDVSSTKYRVYRFILQILRPASPSRLQIRVKRSGQGSFDEGTTDYLYRNIGSSLDNSANAAQIILGGSISDVSNIYALTGEIVFFSFPNQGYQHFQWRTSSVDASSGEGRYIAGMGARKTTQTIVGVQIRWEGGINFHGSSPGTIKLYGLRS